MSTLYVDNLQPNLGSRVMAAGHVVQVVSAIKTDTATTSSTSAVDTGLEATITPTSATSKILIIIDAVVSHDVINLKRTYFTVSGGNAASYIGASGASGKQAAFTFCPRSGDSYAMMTVSGKFLDSPATTSAITYKLQWFVESNSAYLNRPATEDVNGARNASTITLMEIAQ